jgi:hypothetical protein
VSIDSTGRLLVAEATAIRQVTTTGLVSTLAQTTLATSVASSPSGLLAYAQRDETAGTFTVRRLNLSGQGIMFATVPVAAGDNLHLYGTANGRLYGVQSERVVEISESGTVTPVAGTVTGANNPTPVDGSGAAARFRSIHAVTGDLQGNLYVIDGTLIRKVTPSGQVTTLAGNTTATLPADGTGSAASFLSPFSLAIMGRAMCWCSIR